MLDQPEPVSVSPPANTQRGAQMRRLLLALVLAVAGGLAVRHFGPHGIAAAQVVGQVGQLWLNALRMTLVPLVFCLMTNGVASIARTAEGGVVARVSVAVFLVLLVAGSLLGALAALALIAVWPIAMLHAAPIVAASAAPPSLLAEFVALVPTNPIASAAEGAMAPLIIFATLFGAAIVRIASPLTTLLLDMLSAIAAALLVIVGCVLRLAPAGIFALLFATIASVGEDATKGLLQYAVLASILPALAVVAGQVVGSLSGVGPVRFARAAMQPQTLAATTQSSTACLPALLEAATSLRLPPPIVAAITPLAVATFRFGNVFAGLGTGIVAANLFGVHPPPARIATALALGVLTNVGSVGGPGAAGRRAAWGPVYLALGAPLEALTLYITFITVPDILITVGNVTADLAATSLISTLVTAYERRRTEAA